MLEFDAVSWTDDPPQLVATCTLPADLPAFRGHFPGQPLLPAVAQLSLVRQLIARRWGDIIGGSGLKFIRPLRPGDQLSCRVTALTDGRLQIEIKNNDGVATKGILTVAEEHARVDNP